MFKSLREKLFGVKKDLEETLGAEIEKELAKERAKPKAAPPAAQPTIPTPTPVPAPPHAGPPVAAAAPTAAREVAAAPPNVPPIARAHTPAPPTATTAPAAPIAPKAPSGYKEAKRLGAEEEASRKKETVEERLQRELQAAVEQQKALEKIGGEGQRILLPADKLEDLLWNLELGLLESDVAMPVIEAIKSSVREQLTVTGVARKDPEQIVKEVLRSAIKHVLMTGRLDFDEFIERRLKQKKPVVLMFVGVNGTGKTTSIAKLAHHLQKNRISSVMAAGDTFRAGAIEQLSLHGDRLGVKVIKHTAGSDPAAVAFDAIEHAKSRNKDVVLLDTAGRMQTNSNLMAEMAKIRRVARPDHVIFVGDSLSGNDAVEQAREFNKVVGIDGVILTKVDADAKGGAALSVAYTIGKPLLFVGVGQEYEDQIPFDADWMVDRLFGDEEAAVAA
jgi:fused signal recognition particle receptor